MDAFAAVPKCTEEEFQDTLLQTNLAAPACPKGWSDISLAAFPAGHKLHGVKVYRRIGDQLQVMLTASHWPGDDRVWLHVSLSRRSRMPSYEDVADVKRLFVGEDRKAFQVFPAKQFHVNIHNFCLHLWSCIDGSDGLPEFGQYGTI